jgi:ABC-type taurine transport system ATPase subunit
MQQRVAIARSYVLDPDVLLMDEPFGALDAQTRTVMQEELIKLSRVNPRTVLFITHAVDEAVYLADRVVVMTRRPGRIGEIIDVAAVRGRNWDRDEHRGVMTRNRSCTTPDLGALREQQALNDHWKSKEEEAVIIKNVFWAPRLGARRGHRAARGARPRSGQLQPALYGRRCPRRERERWWGEPA